MVGGGGNIARGVKQDIAHTLIQQTSEARRRHVTNAFNTYVVCQKSSCIFNRKMNISAFAKVFYISKYTRNFIKI